VRDQIGRQVIVLNPTPHFSAQLRDVSTAYRKITEASLKAAQFPEQLTDQHGTFHRPAAWAKAKPK